MWGVVTIDNPSSVNQIYRKRSIKSELQFLKSESNIYLKRFRLLLDIDKQWQVKNQNNNAFNNQHSRKKQNNIHDIRRCFSEQIPKLLYLPNICRSIVTHVRFYDIHPNTHIIGKTILYRYFWAPEPMTIALKATTKTVHYIKRQSQNQNTLAKEPARCCRF